ncbi:MAG: CHRD domain-containing protein [Novosphingobium sp.]
MTKAMMLLGGALAAMLAVPAAAESVVLVATLNGANEPAGGDADGTGSFEMEVDPAEGGICYTLKAEGIDPATAAHIHTGAAGVNGPPVVTLSVGSGQCIAAKPEVLKPIVAAPAGYYVNVHNAAYPGGAIRGQLAVKN